VGIGDNQLHTAEPSGPKAAHERRPERTVLAVADVDAQHLSVAIRAYSGHDHDCSRDDSTANASLHIGGIREQIWKLDVIEWPSAERFKIGVEAGTNAADLRFRDARRSTEGNHEVINGSRRDA
jgi:hypothetical protein